MGNTDYEEYDDIYSGYDEDGSVGEISGITDKVTDYTYTGLSYPCVIFKQGTSLEKHKVNIISNMVKSSVSGVLKDISLYFENAGQLYKLGMIAGIQVDALIEIAGRDSLIAFNEQNIELKGSLIYTLCSF